MKKVYIAGRITGECETPELLEKCFAKFNEYGKILLEGDEYIIEEKDFITRSRTPIDKIGSYTHGLYINRFEIPRGTWQEYMRRDISVLCQCDEVHFLPDWIFSKGAKIEMYIAKNLGIPIIKNKFKFAELIEGNGEWDFISYGKKYEILDEFPDKKEFNIIDDDGNISPFIYDESLFNFSW